MSKNQLLQKVNELDQKLMDASADLEREWDTYTTNLLPEKQPYWNMLSEDEIQSAIVYAEEMLGRM